MDGVFELLPIGNTRLKTMDDINKEGIWKQAKNIMIFHEELVPISVAMQDVMREQRENAVR
jgi:hypothetical protein